MPQQLVLIANRPGKTAHCNNNDEGNILHTLIMPQSKVVVFLHPIFAAV
jgi:hypothetical protein